MCATSLNTSPVEIRKAAAEDAPRVASVLKQAFREFESLYTKDAYAATAPEADAIRIRMEQGPLWVALHEGKIVGTASVVPEPAAFYIRGMAVLPAARGFGIGRFLLEEIESSARASGCQRLYLSTTPFLARAIRLYEAFGFRRTKEEPHDLFGTPLFSMEKVLE